jgi:hypothetical protein
MPRTLFRSLLGFLAVLTLLPAAARAQTASATLSANLGGLARLTFSSNSLTFPDSDPDTVPLVDAAGGPVTTTAKARATPGGQVTLTVEASDDLRSGVDTLPVSLLTWIATGPGFVNGTLSAATPQTVATWTGSGVHVGTQTYRFQNLWTHPTGTYTVTLVYTLSAA